MKIVHQRSYYHSKISKKAPERNPYRYYRYPSSRRYSSPVSKRKTTTFRYARRSSSSSQRRSKKRKFRHFESVFSRKSKTSKKTIRKKRRRRKSHLENEERGSECRHQEDRMKTGSEIIPDNENEMTPVEEEMSQEVQYTHERKAEDCVTMEKATEPEVEESLEPVVVNRGNDVSSQVEI